MNSGRSVQIQDGLYQVWWTEYPLNGEDPCSAKDPGHRLAGAFNNIKEAVEYMQDNKSYKPTLTKLVTYHYEIKDISEVEQT